MYFNIYISQLGNPIYKERFTNVAYIRTISEYNGQPPYRWGYKTQRDYGNNSHYSEIAELGFQISLFYNRGY